MNELESCIDDPLETESRLLEEAKQSLSAAILAHLDCEEDNQDRELVARFEDELEACNSLQELIMVSSTLCMEEALDFDPLDVLRKQKIWENESQGDILETGPIGIDETPEEVARERTRRMAILVQYKPFVSDRFIQERLSIHFLAEGSLELLIYQGVVWALAEPHIDRIHGNLLQRYGEQSPGIHITKKKQKALKKEAEEKALALAKDLLKRHGIAEPQA